MKRKLIEENDEETTCKKPRKINLKRGRENVVWNCSGASSDEECDERPHKKVYQELRDVFLLKN